MIIQEGIVLRERPVGEHDKFIDILTKEKGVIELSARGSRKITGKTAASTQLFAYSRFCMEQRGDRLYLNSAEPIHIFYGLRNSLTKLSLASYFAEALNFCISEEATNGDILRLFLNTLHYLESGQRDEAMLKSVFELRLMADIGYMPAIVGCRSCGVFEPDELYFGVDSGCFYCSDCFGKDNNDGYKRVKLPVLSAVRHIVLADHNRLFNFRVSDRTMKELSAIAEDYITSRLERKFKTLDFYRSLVMEH